MTRVDFNPRTFRPEWAEALQPAIRQALATWIAAERDYLARPAFHLQAFLDRVAPIVERYYRRGKVAALAAEASRKVAELAAESLEYPPAFGCAAPDPVPSDPTAAEDACNALAEELRRLQASATATSKAGKRSAEARAWAADDFLEEWHKVRGSCDSDAEAHRLLATEHGTTPEAIKKKKQRADERSGR